MKGCTTAGVFFRELFFMEKEEKMIYLNGKPAEVSEGISLAELVRERQYCLDYIAAELNGEIVPKQQYEDTILHNEDKLEIVSFVGGG